MKQIIFFAILFFAVILQTTIFQNIKIFGTTPNIALVFLIFIAFWEKDYKKTFFSATALGILFDVLSGPFFGVFLLIFFCLAFILNISARTLISSDNNPAFLGMVFLGTCAYYVLYYICINSLSVFGVVDYKIVANIIFFETLAVEIVLNLLIALLLIPAKKIMNQNII